MLNHVAVAFIAFLLALGVSVSVQADVTGSFNLDIMLSPEGTQTEAVTFLFDIMSNLQFNSVFSGITAGADIGFGVTGFEFGVIQASASLGALTLRDQNIFAIPFACTAFLEFMGNGPDDQINGVCPGRLLVPIGDVDGDDMADPNAVAFVQKRTEAEINIAGLEISTLMLFEDVDFPDIRSGDDHEHDHFNGDVVYYVYGVNGMFDDQTPTFGIGGVLTISGQTVSGVNVESETAICAKNVHHIKKRQWDYEVTKQCASLLLGVIVEGGGSDFLFESQKLWITGLEAGDLSLDIHTEVQPPQNFHAMITASYAVADLANLMVTVDVDQDGPNALITQLISDNIIFILHDTDIDFRLESAVGIFNFLLNPDENLIDLQLRLEADQNGFSGLILTFGFTRGLLTVGSETRFAPDGSNGFDWVRTGFRMHSQLGLITLGADFGFRPSGITDALVTVGILF